MNPLSIGEARIHRVEEITARLPFAMFGLGEAELAAHADWLFPRWVDRADMHWDMVVQSFVVEIDGRVVVVDPCVGNGRSLPHFALFDQLDTPFIERFAATGFRPEDVDAVFCTHLHSDHCGWNTTLRGGRYVPTFPNARYYLAKRELDRWDPAQPGYDPVPENEGIFAASVAPVIEAGLAEIIPAHFRLSSSLVVEPAYGHTFGHSVLQLTSGQAHACFSGDVFHHPIELLIPEIDARTCEDHAATVATRKRLIRQLVDTGGLLIPAHFAAPHVGHLHESGGELRFEPLAQAFA